MDIKTFMRVAPILLKHNIVPYIHGKQGVGKTYTIKQLGKQMGFDSTICVELGAQGDVGDIVGLLRTDADGNHYHTRPRWMPTTGKHLIFLDEFNRVAPDAVQPMLTFLQFGRINQHVLPEGCAIVLAGNYDSKDFMTTRIKDAAIKSRCCHIDWQPTTTEWLEYMESKGDHGSNTVANFIRANPEMLRSKSGSASVLPDEPDPRAWDTKIAPLEGEDLGDARYEVYAGCVGVAAASGLMSWKNQKTENIELKRLLQNFDNVKYIVEKVLESEVRDFALLNQPMDELAETLKQNPHFLTNIDQVENLKKYILAMPVELILKIKAQLQPISFVNERKIFEDSEFAEAVRAKALKERESGKKVG